jgi:hypothetical protein
MEMVQPLLRTSTRLGTEEKSSSSPSGRLVAAPEAAGKCPAFIQSRNTIHSFNRRLESTIIHLLHLCGISGTPIEPYKPRLWFNVITYFHIISKIYIIKSKLCASAIC